MDTANNRENPYSAPSVDAEVINAVVVDDHGGLSVYYQVEIDDLAEFNVRHMRKSSPARRSYFFSWFALPVLLLAVSMLLAWREQHGAGMLFSLVLFGGAAVYWLVRWPSMYRSRIRRSALQLYREGRNQAIFGPRRLSISPQSFTDVTQFTETRSLWEVVERIESDDQAMYIYTSAVNAVIVPQRCFASGEECRRFVETARRYWREATEATAPFAGPATSL